MRNLLKLTGCFLVAVMLLSGCSADQDSTPVVSAQGGEESVQEEITQSTLPEQDETPALALQEESEVREGTSDDTLSTPEDFPADYDYGSGLAGDWGGGQLYARLPEPEGNATVLNYCSRSDPDSGTLFVGRRKCPGTDPGYTGWL